MTDPAEQLPGETSIIRFGDSRGTGSRQHDLGDRFPSMSLVALIDEAAGTRVD
jgi:hypothetical protein